MSNEQTMQLADIFQSTPPRREVTQCRQQACDTINELLLLRGGMEPLSVDWSDYLSGGILDTEGDEVE